MGHRLFPLLSIQVSPVPTKGVPELAGPVLKSLQTLGLAVVGSGRSQPQHGEFASPRVALSQLAESGRRPRRAEQFEIAPPVYHPERDRLPSSSPSPAVAQSSGICTPGISSSPITRNAVGHDVTTGRKSARPCWIKPSVGRCANRDNQNRRRNLHRGFSTRLFVGITASGSMFNVNRLGA